MDIFLTYLKVFAVGGAICAVCQLIIDKTKLTSSRILVGLVTMGVPAQRAGHLRSVCGICKGGGHRAAAGLRTLAFSGSAGGNTGKRLAGSVDRGSYRYGGRDCGGCVFRLYQCSYILFRHKEIALDLRRYKKKRAADAAPKNTELHHPRVGCGAAGVLFIYADN